MSNLEKGIRVLYVDLLENFVSKRFIVPNTLEMATKVKALHVSSIYPVTIDTMGEGIIKEQIMETDFDSFSSIPSLVLSHYQVELIGHPVLPVGVARYSEELVSFLKELQVAESTPLLVEASLPQAPTKALAEQFRSQLSPQPKIMATIIPEKVSPSLPVVEEQLSLDEVLQQKREEKEARKGGVPTPQSLVQMVKEIHAAVCPESALQAISAKELSSWFIKYSTEHGMDKTFDYLAAKITNWE